jgi:hypothetical protein
MPMPESMRLRVALCVAALGLAGCSANFHSVFRHKPLETEGASITSLDAKQRAILSNEGQDGIRRFCSEPSPDVFSVVAQALAFGGSLEKSADPRSLEAALKATFSSAEQGSTIPRTQTINMLRELMFRTCERFLNGGYSPLELSVQAVRDQRLMISILAVEQLTGAVTAPVVGIGASGSASGGPGADAIVRLDDAGKEKDAADLEVQKAQSDVDQSQQACGAIDDAVKNKADLTAEQKTQQDACNNLKTALASAKERSAKADERDSALRKLATEGGVSALASVSAEKIAEMTRAHGESVEKVSNDVVKIVTGSFNDGSEVMLFCIKALSPDGTTHGVVDQPAAPLPPGLESDPNLRASCMSYLIEKVKLEQESLRAQQEQLKAEQAESSARSQTIAADLFDQVWPQMERTFRDPKAKKRFVEDLKRSLLSTEQSRAECFTTATTRGEYRECFMKLEATRRYDVQHLLTGDK